MEIYSCDNSLPPLCTYTEEKITLLTLNSRLPNFKKESTPMLLILKINICCIINIKACLPLTILCSTLQVRISSRFSQYFFLKVKMRFLPTLILKLHVPSIAFSPFLKHIRHDPFRKSTDMNLKRKKKKQYPVSAWCPLKGHTQLNKPATFSCRFVYVCVTFKWMTFQ